MSHPVSQSITRRSASNLALAFVLLPRPQREAMSALYAFCRQVDDVADDDRRPEAERRADLARWRADIRSACTEGRAQFAVNRELIPVLRRYRLPFELFNEILCGVEMDLDIKRYPTYSDLEHYCYRVASAVGLLSIEIFGYRDPACREYAVFLGKALQFTNILRDVRNDAERGRIYLPQEDLERAGVRPEEILTFQDSDRFRALASGFARRARAFYDRARAVLPAVDRRSMIAAELMGSLYWQLLRRIETRQYAVLGPDPIRLGKPAKLFLIVRTWWRLSVRRGAPNYGTA